MQFGLLVAAAALTSAAPALAQFSPGTTTVTTIGNSAAQSVPVGQSWTAIPSENTNGGSGQITAQNISDSDGSLNITGDRARVQTGYQYLGGTNSGTLANNIESMSADYFINTLGSNALSTPAFRVMVQDGAQRSELIWEGNYNNPEANVGLGAGMMSSTDLFYQFVAGAGSTMNPNAPGAYLFRTLAAWGDTYSTSAFVSGLSIGVGSGAGSGFSANVDNLAFTTTTGTSRFNFATAAAVPEPGTWAMMLLGFGGIGATMRRQRRVRAIAQIA